MHHVNFIARNEQHKVDTKKFSNVSKKKINLPIEE